MQWTILERRLVRSRLLNFILLLICLILTSLHSSIAQPQQTQVGANSAPNNSSESARITELENKVDKLTSKVDSELRAADIRFQTMAHSTDRAFSVLFALGALGSLLAGVFVTLSWRREHKRYEGERTFFEKLQNESHEREAKFAEQQHKRYERERNFFEKLQNESHERGAKFAEQQLSLGNNFLSRSDAMLSGQIESITKLGDVIDLVRKTYETQLKREEKQSEDHERLEKMNEIVSGFTEHYQSQYNHSRDLILTFKDHSRMAWTHLSPQEESLTTRARMYFETIPEFVLSQQRTKDPYEFAQVYQLMGVSAFYANDIDAAAKYLETARTIYATVGTRPEDQYPQAFCNHFLGLVEKNWRHVDRPHEANLAEAKHHLEDANRQLSAKSGEFLTPLTLAEVLSYSERDRDSARKLLDEKIDLLVTQKSSVVGLDDNQHTLLGRAYILRGNLDFLDGQIDQALIWYKRSNDHDKQNPYALLSIAHAMLKNTSEKAGFYRHGLETLEASGATAKKENAVRVTALAWAVIASHEIGDQQRKDKALKELDMIGSNIRLVANREPLFFCPTEKTLVTFKRLRQNLARYISSE